MGGRALEDEVGKGEEVSVDEEGIGGKQSHLKDSGRASPQRLADDPERSFWVRPQAHPAQTPRKGRFWRELTDAHSVPSNNSRKNCRIGQQIADAYSRSGQATRST